MYSAKSNIPPDSTILDDFIKYNSAKETIKKTACFKYLQYNT